MATAVATLASWLPAVAVWLPAIAYWLLTLANVQPARPLLRWRAIWITTWVVAASVAALTSGAVLSFAVVVVAVAYQWHRQWLWAVPCVVLRPASWQAHDDDWLAVMADGRAVAVDDLRRARLAVTDDGALLVCCGLARSLVALQVPAGARPRLNLPLPVGFALTHLRHTYDGPTGHRCDRGDPLAQLPLAVLSAHSWRQRFAEPTLLTTGRRCHGPPRWPSPFQKRLTPADLAWGSISVEGWQIMPATPADLPLPPLASQPWPQQRFLARWAARMCAVKPFLPTNLAATPPSVSMWNERP
ncbi:MAG: hypothetical protein EXR77_08405 [Myxococcales bacterium]|nr:hypothetical protein [Myxococcales bacterium]